MATKAVFNAQIAPFSPKASFKKDLVRLSPPILDDLEMIMALDYQ